jgi:hypothetical protein
MDRRTDIPTEAGVITTFALEDGALITGTTQDCDPIADHTTELRNSGFTGPSNDMRLAASIPKVFVEAYLNKHAITWTEFARSEEHKRRLIMDPDLAKFRVWGGRI